MKYIRCSSDHKSLCHFALFKILTIPLSASTSNSSSSLIICVAIFVPIIQGFLSSLAEIAAWHLAIRTMKNQPVDSRAFEVMGKLADARKARVHTMIEPVYEAMLKKGYSHEELTK